MRKEVTLSKFQKEFISRRDDSLLVLATGISAGKSKVAGLWCALETMNDKKRIIAAAQNFKALAEVLFREIKYWLNYFEVEYTEKFGQKITLANGSEIFGASAENPEGILGFTDISAAIIDEAAYCPEELYHYIGDRMRGDGIVPKYRLISSPSNKIAAKWFTDLCMKHQDCVIHATALDNPFTSDEFKQSLKDRYGEGSNLYRQQVLGEFIATDSSDCLITIDKIPTRRLLDPSNVYYIGVDVARYGVDNTVIAVRNNAEVVDCIVMNHADSHKIVSAIKKAILGRQVAGIYLDGTGGWSSGVYDILKLEMDNVYEVNFGSKSKDDNCLNNRAYMYKMLRDALLNGFYVPYRDMVSEICAQRIKLNNTGKLQLVEKSVIKEEIGKSPDSSDALALSFYSVDDSYVPITPNRQKELISIFFN